MKQSGYKSLQVVYFSLLAGQILFILIAVYLITKNLFTVSKPELENIFMPVLVIVAFICIISGNRIYKARVSRLKDVNPIASKFVEYRAVTLLRWALLEAPCLFAIICYLLTSNFLFLVVAALLLFIFVSTAPIKNKVASEMGITSEELDKIL
ncbi:MAG: hypothetical protein ABIO04_01045 [Ferruginibacter sp.]